MRISQCVLLVVLESDRAQRGGSGEGSFLDHILGPDADVGCVGPGVASNGCCGDDTRRAATEA